MEYAWYPQDGPQLDFCESWEDEVLFGGAAGGGKTDCLIAEAVRDVSHSDYKGLILRRTFPQLQEILDRTRELYPLIGGEYRASEHRWYFPSRATVKLGHMSDDGDEYNYQGHQYQYIAFDEAGQFLPKQLSYLFSRCRSTNPAIPKRVRYATNPGGPAHQYLKDRFRIGLQDNQTFLDFIEIQIPGTMVKVKQVISRRFIPAKLADNPILLNNDPLYLARLMQLPEIERMRLLEGIWDAFEGQAFQELNKEVHGFSFEPPPEWEYFGAFDWGYSSPYAYGVFAVDYEGKIYLWKLLYGAKTGGRFGVEGLRQTSPEIARNIRKLESELGVKVRWRVAGRDIWSAKPNKDGILGPSPAEDMGREGVHFIRADNDRIRGWQQIHKRLELDPDGQPYMYFHRDINDAWRTFALMTENPNNPEDLLERGVEDHIPEMVRYAVMARPMKPKVAPRPDHNSFRAERRRYIQAKKYATRYGVPLATAYGKVE
jgi:hypothetical protein